MSENYNNNFVPLELYKACKDSLITKIVVISIIMFLLSVPQNMIMKLIDEREQRSEEVIEQITQKWGKEQIIHGPILTIPIKVNDKIRHLHINPSELDIQGQLKPEERKKSIFKSIVYLSELDINFSFNLQQLQSLPEHYQIDTKNTTLNFGVSDLKGLSQSIELNWDNEKISAQPGHKVPGLRTQGFHFPIILHSDTAHISASTQIKIKGSRQLALNPSGKKSLIQLQSSWPHPGFQGSFLPDSYNISDSGFDAAWEVHDLQRNFVQSWWDNQTLPSQEQLCEVRLVQIQGTYSQIHRLVKYTLLFLCFTFGAVFISERISRKIIHPLQYILIGISSLLFYVLTLSLSEHIGFHLSYIIAATLSTLMIALYSKSLFQNWKNSAAIAALTGSLYGYLFGTIQLEDYALLMGTCGLVVILAAVMYFTKDLAEDHKLLTKSH